MNLLKDKIRALGEMFYPMQDPFDDLEAMEFRYYEPNEFADPVYEIWLGDRYYGNIVLFSGYWSADLASGYMHDEAFLVEVADKLNELNNALEERKAFLWGL